MFSLLLLLLLLLFWKIEGARLDMLPLNKVEERY